VLWGGRSLVEWIRAGGRPARAIPGLRARLSWSAYWFEHNWRTGVRRLGETRLPDDPVFILGLWRSGTTVLHELLTGSMQSLTPQTWQCLNPSTCFLTGPPRQESSVARPMDRGRISTHGPQEDEFALLLLGEPSLYRAFIDPRRLSECRDYLQHGQLQALPRWQDFVRGVAAAAAPDRPLLLKSPGHTFRLPLLRQLFPRARFVWIARHCGEVFASNLKMWRAMMQRYALWECPPALLEDFLLSSLDACSLALAQCIEELPRESLLWIEFEELRARPREVLERTLRFLAPDRQATDLPRIDQALARIPIHAGSRSRLPDEVVGRRLETLMASARERFGQPR
jgi:omega-hydroxy-beta-dihydromenaquinone-9 sulfotransferase